MIYTAIIIICIIMIILSMFYYIYRSKVLRKRLNLQNQHTFSGLHRSGWEYALQSINELHDENGILFDGNVEKNFSWYYDSEIGEDGIQSMEKMGILPYKRRWVGFIHNPQNAPDWFANSNKFIFQKLFKESLKNCVGLWALSEYHAEWLRKNLNVLVSVVYHPTDTDVSQFDYNKFLRNEDKKIYQIGWWLRKLNSIYQLPIDKVYRKIRLDPKTDSIDLQGMYDKERKIMKLEFEDRYYKNTYRVDHLSNEEYDKIYTENIMFVNLYDASANNAVIEAIARATPILVNPLPAVVEYLGEDYPFYFESLEEAANKALDMNLVLYVHEYLKKSPMRKKITGEYFCKSIKNSEVFKKI